MIDDGSSGGVVRTVRRFLVVAAASSVAQLRRWARQRLALRLAFVLPVTVATIVSLALGGGPGFEATVALVDLDDGPAATAFKDEALGGDQVRDLVAIREVRTTKDARRLVDRGAVDTAVILPVGLTRSVTDTSSARKVTPEVLRPGGASVASDLVELVADVFMVQARAAGIAADEGRALPASPRLTVAPEAAGGRSLDAATHYGPAVGLFFVMVAVGFAIESNVDDRSRGIDARISTSVAPLGAVAVGRSVAALTMGAWSFAVTAITMQFAFGRGWGPPASVAALIAAVALAYAGLATVFARLVRTPAQAQALAMTLAFVMAEASGSFSPPGAAISPHPLARLLPATVALDGFALATTERVGPSALAPTLFVLMLIGAGGVALASVVRRRES